jgi:hypothetical protein
MKTKLLAVILLAGGSMFAQTRFSFGTTTSDNNHSGYYRQTAPSNSSQATPRYEQRNSDNRYEDAYGSRDSIRGFRQDRDRDSNRDQDDNRGRAPVARYENNHYGNRFGGR